ncbi:MAG: DUF1674 domain-containing protein [Pseudomonadota bacterium]
MTETTPKSPGPRDYRPGSADAQAPDEPLADEPGADSSAAEGAPAKPREIGGRKGPEPTRYGDWEKNGRCIDF